MKNKLNIRKYGTYPYTVVVVHGGPGAPGEMKPVAEELSKNFGVLEPLQSADSVEGQIKELKEQIEQCTQSPVTLIGYSWGAWLGYLLAAKYPKLIKKLILVSSGPFEKIYAEKIMPTRMDRLSTKEKKKVKKILKSLQNKENSDKTLKEFGTFMDKADTFKPLPAIQEDMEFQPEIYESVWTEASKLRSNGELLKMGKKIICPVVAIHGDYDPHPAQGVKKPLSRTLKNFRFISLENCGHKPWKEKQAKDKFYQILKAELE